MHTKFCSENISRSHLRNLNKRLRREEEGKIRQSYRLCSASCGLTVCLDLGVVGVLNWSVLLISVCSPPLSLSPFLISFLSVLLSQPEYGEHSVIDGNNSFDATRLHIFICFKLAPRSWFPLKKLIVTQLVRNSPPYLEPEDSSTCSQDSDNSEALCNIS
jgi:hypothetical protein